jgi:hypothetical protein
MDMHNPAPPGDSACGLAGRPRHERDRVCCPLWASAASCCRASCTDTPPSPLTWTCDCMKPWAHRPVTGCACKLNATCGLLARKPRNAPRWRDASPPDRVLPRLSRRGESRALSPGWRGTPMKAAFEGMPMSERHATDTAIITYADFIDICHVDDINDFGGFRVETNGLWVNLPPRAMFILPQEKGPCCRGIRLAATTNLPCHCLAHW